MNGRVLVVDDDAVGRYTLRGLLEEEGLAVEEAPDGAAAIELLAQRDFDLVISDLRMPKLDGMSSCGESRRSPRRRASSC